MKKECEEVERSIRSMLDMGITDLSARGIDEWIMGAVKTGLDFVKKNDVVGKLSNAMGRRRRLGGRRRQFGARGLYDLEREVQELEFERAIQEVSKQLRSDAEKAANCAVMNKA